MMNEAWSRAKRRKKELDDDIVRDVVNETLETLKLRKDLYPSAA
jgi:hypothetical protein